jgi:hypothetical protein
MATLAWALFLVHPSGPAPAHAESGTAPSALNAPSAQTDQLKIYYFWKAG